MVTEILRGEEITLLGLTIQLLYFVRESQQRFLFISSHFCLFLVANRSPKQPLCQAKAEAARYYTFYSGSAVQCSPLKCLFRTIRFESLPQSFRQSVLLPKTIPKIKLDIWYLVIMNEHPGFQFGFSKCSGIWVFI